MSSFLEAIQSVKLKHTNSIPVSSEQVASEIVESVPGTIGAVIDAAKAGYNDDGAVMERHHTKIHEKLRAAHEAIAALHEYASSLPHHSDQHSHHIEDMRNAASVAAAHLDAATSHLSRANKVVNQ